MPSSKSVLESVTPDSVKVLMIIEAIVISFLTFWLANEYAYNVYFRIYIDMVFVQHLTTYTIAIGLGLGLAGTVVAAVLYKTMREAKVKLEAVAPRIRGSVEKLITGVPALESNPLGSTSLASAAVQPKPDLTARAPAMPVSPLKASEDKK